MHLQTLMTLVLASLTFSNIALGYSSRHMHRRALLPLASYLPRSPLRANLDSVPAPTPAALLPRLNVDAAVPIPQASLSLTAVPANDTTIATTSTSTGPPATGTATAIGGIGIPAITMTQDPDRPFKVNGNTFTTQKDALDRACAIQHNQCADAVNGGELSNVDVSACDAQQASCAGEDKR
ncbi:ribosomal s17 protein [Rutstroemia sp. NJR-2017a WRK4]|nr:ribosomal s17 protein [Rutstroemia sp. NJR-2017a WRK4]